jgi:hypothetical protein
MGIQSRLITAALAQTVFIAIGKTIGTNIPDLKFHIVTT